MKTVQLDYKNIVNSVPKLSICLGYFDGVHLGHANLLQFAKNHAINPLGLLTFFKPISSIIDNGKSNDVLTSLDDRFKIINRFGLDYYFVLHIDDEFLKYSPNDFIDFLKKMNVEEIFVGEDYTFGINRSGTIADLKKNFRVHVVPLLIENGEKVSTSYIKELLNAGNLDLANHLMGHNYLVTGTVIHGQQIGHKIGFPTLNLKLMDNYVFPKYGVYKTICYINNVPHVSITNVGIKPTIGGANEPNIEVHLKDYKNDNYGDIVRLEFLKFIRPEMKFASLEELKKQISNDIKKAF